jgi:MinD-like ATPase involved in chromosome partitioning or flagellar assembly
MSNHTMPDWAYKTLRNDDLRVYENSNGKVIISQVNERHKEDIMTTQAIIAYLKSIKKKPVVMHPEDPFIGRHIAKKDIIAVLSEREKAICVEE